MKLNDCAEPLALDVAFWMGALTNPEYPVNQLGRLTLTLSEKLRAVGIILLLTNGDSDGFYYNLIRSARARRTYLQRVRDVPATDDHHFASGRFEPLLDAIAAGDIRLAEEITGLSPLEWRSRCEYKDDYCYAQLLRRFLVASPPENEIARLLEEFESYLDGQVEPRLDICMALATPDQDSFDKCFEVLLDAREAQIEADKQRGQLEEPHIVAQRFVFVEGLAILRLAESRGLKTFTEYRLCPSLARVPMSAPIPDE